MCKKRAFRIVIDKIDLQKYRVSGESSMALILAFAQYFTIVSSDVEHSCLQHD